MTIPPTIRRACLSAALLAVLPLAAWAAEPKAVVKGPASCKVGQTVFLSAKDSATDVDRPLEWRVLGDEPGQSIIFDQGGMHGSVYAFTASAAGTLDVLLIAQGDVDGRVKVAVQAFRLVVQADQPAPAPTPQPVPPPAPTPAPDPIPPSPQPIVHPPGSDQALGQQFAASMAAGTSGVLDQAALGTWTTTSELTSQLMAGFDKAFATSWASTADSFQAIAGPASETPVPPTTKAAIMAKLKAVAEGAKGGVK